jgi:Type ISP C-terminal specificity domain
LSTGLVLVWRVSNDDRNGLLLRQVFATAPEDLSPTSGPALTLTGLVPDQHHYHGRGGRAYPLWLDRGATRPNIKPEFLTYLAKIYGQPVKAEDVIAYVAAVMAHPAFTARFAPDLVRPGLRLPITANAKLFAEAVALGNEVIWLHSYGERFSDPATNRPKQAPRLPKEIAPTIPADGMIPSAPELLPDAMDYDPATPAADSG